MLILSKGQGQLANKLYFFSRFIPIANQSGRIIYNPIFNNELKYFSYFNSASFCLYPIQIPKNKIYKFVYGSYLFILYKLLAFCKRIRFYNSPLHSIINIGKSEIDDEVLLQMLRKKKYFFYFGWPAHSKNTLLNNKEIILRTFTFNDEYKIASEKIINKFRNNIDIIIGVHIRQGDYKEFRGGEFYFNKEIYVRKMNEIKAKFQNKKVLFIVCSDETQDFSDINYLKIFNSHNNKIIDLLLLSKCDYIIGPPSTFSAWASFYGQVPLYHIHDPNEEIDFEKFKIPI